MKQFARVQQGNSVIPVLVSGTELLDLRSLIDDITPETIASGLLHEFDVATLKAIAGKVQYLAPIRGVRQLPATGFNYKKHIQELKVPTPTEPEVFLKSQFSLTGPFDPIRRGPNPGVKLDWEVSSQSSLAARHRTSKPRMRLTTFSAMYASTTSRIEQLKSTPHTSIILFALSPVPLMAQSAPTSQQASIQ